VLGVVNLSGFLVSPRSAAVDPEDLGDTPLFWGHGTLDPAVPFELAISGRERLRAAGRSIEARDYGIGHWVSPEEMADLKEWMEASIPGWGG
jgi:phospholipase/carboxylesterase